MLKLHKVVTAVTKGEADSIWLTHKWETDDRGCGDLSGFWCPHQWRKVCHLLKKRLGVV